jgi:hypothetical protein
MPTTCEASERSSISLSTAKLSESVRAVETTFTKSGSNASMRFAACSRPLVRVKSWKLTSSDVPTVRNPARKRAICAGFSSSADSTSRSTMWQPASAAFVRISSSAAVAPLNSPPCCFLRQVAIAVKSRWPAINCFSPGSAAAGLASESSRNSTNRQSTARLAARLQSSAGVSPLIATHSFPNLGRATIGGGTTSSVCVPERGIVVN